MDGSLAGNGGHSHVLAQGLLWSLCEGLAVWLIAGLALAVAPGDVASVAFAGRTQGLMTCLS